jgi:hypothetical protein
MPGKGKGNPGGGPMSAGQGPGRSQASPGHLKKAAGARSARDFAPGRTSNAGMDETATDQTATDQTGKRRGILDWFLRRG